MDAESLEELVEQFRHYKASGEAGGTFGRDAGFDRPPSARDAELLHVHLGPSNGWHFRLVQFRRTSNTFLIYTPGYFDRQKFLLIDVIKQAHERCADMLFVAGLADVAARFRTQH